MRKRTYQKINKNDFDEQHLNPVNMLYNNIIMLKFHY